MSSQPATSSMRNDGGGYVRRWSSLITGLIVGIAVLAVVGLFFFATAARADEGGVSFWLRGQFSSFAALPGEPGWSVPTIYFHEHASAGGQRNFIGHEATTICTRMNPIAALLGPAALTFWTPRRAQQPASSLQQSPAASALRSDAVAAPNSIVAPR